jgi:hypothetical protein
LGFERGDSLVEFAGERIGHYRVALWAPHLFFSIRETFRIPVRKPPEVVRVCCRGKDRTRHAQEINALLARNDEEAHALALNGTPGLVVGRQLVPGIVELNFLKQLVANSRHAK